MKATIHCSLQVLSLKKASSVFDFQLDERTKEHVLIVGLSDVMYMLVLFPWIAKEIHTHSFLATCAASQVDQLTRETIFPLAAAFSIANSLPHENNEEDVMAGLQDCITSYNLPQGRLIDLIATTYTYSQIRFTQSDLQQQLGNHHQTHSSHSNID